MKDKIKWILVAAVALLVLGCVASFSQLSRMKEESKKLQSNVSALRKGMSEYIVKDSMSAFSIQTKFENDKTRLHLRMQMQVVLAEFRDTADEAGDFFVKDENDVVVGQRRSCFTGSDNLIETVQTMQSRIPSINEQRLRDGKTPIDVFPLDCTIQRSGKCLILQ